MCEYIPIYSQNYANTFALQLHVCEMVLENEGVHGYVTLDEYQLDFIPLDSDILSLEFPHFFASFFLVRSS